MKRIFENIDFKDKKTVKKMIVIAVLIVAVKNQIQADLVYSIMPDSVDLRENNGFPYILYKQQNEGFDFKEDIEEPMNAVQFYYYDDNDEKIVIDGADTIEYNGEDYGSPYVAFMLNSVDTINQIRKALTVVAVIIIILLIVGLIFLWYKRWSKKQDMEKEKKYGPKKIKATKNKTKK